MDDLPDHEARIKDAFVDELGYWTDGYEAALRSDAEFFDRFRRLVSATAEPGVLEPKVRDLILVAVNNAPTHLERDAVRIHIENAFDHGATYCEVRQVIQLSSAQGVHTMTEGVPILLEEAEIDAATEAPLAEQERARETFERERDYWSDFWEDVARLDPAFLEAYSAYSAYPRTGGPLDEKTYEFVTIAEDAATTHLYLDGLRLHIRNAIEAGASVAELLEVLELVSVIGLKSLGAGSEILAEVAEEQGIDHPPGAE